MLLVCKKGKILDDLLAWRIIYSPGLEALQAL
jgi:hypothetical protein